VPEHLQKFLTDPGPTAQRFRDEDDIRPYLDAEKTPYIHLVDGGVSDNLGLRASISRALALGGFWEAFKPFGVERARKVVFIVVNAAREETRKYYLSESSPPFGAVAGSYLQTSMAHRDADTLFLMRESLGPWTEDVQRQRCGSAPVSTEPGGCGDIRFYFVEVKFDALKDEAERTYLGGLPTSFSLPSEAVDRLRQAAHQLLLQSAEFQQLLRDLQ
jgi:NTE family protein